MVRSFSIDQDKTAETRAVIFHKKAEMSLKKSYSIYVPVGNFYLRGINTAGKTGSMGTNK